MKRIDKGSSVVVPYGSVVWIKARGLWCRSTTTGQTMRGVVTRTIGARGARDRLALVHLEAGWLRAFAVTSLVWASDFDRAARERAR